MAESRCMGKIVYMEIPQWVKKLENDNVAGAIISLLFSWRWDNTADVDMNLLSYLRDRFDNLTDSEIEEIANLLMRHKIVTLKGE